MNKQIQASNKNPASLAERTRGLAAAAAVARDKAVESAKAADQAVREHPYQAIGIATGVGAIVGYLAVRQRARHD